MKTLKKVFLIGLASCAALATGCSGNGMTATDYSKDENWLYKRVIGGSADYDVIYIIGTSVNEQTQENGVSEITDEMRNEGKKGFVSNASQLSAVRSNKNNAYYANVFVPLYRQFAMTYELAAYKSHEDLPNDIKAKEPSVDLKAALDYYFAHHNKNGERPFVLAGHSQGSACLQVMLEDYFLKGGHKSYLKNLVAAYSIGYGVSKKWFNALDTTIEGSLKLTLAQGATDTHCVLSWNTEGPNPDGASILLADEEYDTYLINPLNWKTDNTYASKDENLGSLINNPNYDENDPLSPKKIVTNENDQKFDAQIDLKRGSLVSNEPNSGFYMYVPPFGAIWGGKSLHCSDGAGFYVNMARNLGDRLDVWFNK